MKTIDRVKKCFVEEGFEAVLTRKPSTYPYRSKVDGDLEAHLIALCVSDPPGGYKRRDENGISKNGNCIRGYAPPELRLNARKEHIRMMSAIN